eukprot:SAG22_NODE_8962_length_618_cov_1.190751_1_plen_181_part_10
MRTLGIVFQYLSFTQIADSNLFKSSSWLLLLETAVQYANYLSLLMLIAPMDNGWHRIKTICQLLQGYQALEIVYDVSLHIIYSTQTDSVGSGGLQVDAAHSSKNGNSNSFHDLRIGSLFSFLVARLAMFRFFSYKAQNPECLATEEMHVAVPNVDRSSISGSGLLENAQQLEPAPETVVA